MSDESVYHPDSGLTEGVAPVPRWVLLVFGLLSLTFVLYLGRYLVGAQPSSAQMRTSEPAAAPAADDAAPEGE